MEDEEQAKAYAEADFSIAHQYFVERFSEQFPELSGEFHALDLGCGTADVTLRFARRYPDCLIDGVDGARVMLQRGHQALHASGLAARVRLMEARLPNPELPARHYAAVLSNSLLHHLANPGDLWACIRQYAQPDAAIFVMDLLRPSTLDEAIRLVRRYADGEPAILQRDFLNSLRAAYTLTEVADQLAEAGLDFPVEQVSDRHFIVAGRYGANGS